MSDEHPLKPRPHEEDLGFTEEEISNLTRPMQLPEHMQAVIPITPDNLTPGMTASFILVDIHHYEQSQD